MVYTSGLGWQTISSNWSPFAKIAIVSFLRNLLTPWLLHLLLPTSVSPCNMSDKICFHKLGRTTSSVSTTDVGLDLFSYATLSVLTTGVDTHFTTFCALLLKTLFSKFWHLGLTFSASRHLFEVKEARSFVVIFHDSAMSMSSPSPTIQRAMVSPKLEWSQSRTSSAKACHSDRTQTLCCMNSVTFRDPTDAGRLDLCLAELSAHPFPSYLLRSFL